MVVTAQINMNAFEKWASGLLDYEEIQERLHQRERHVALILPADKLKERWEKINYQPPVIKPKQLELWDIDIVKNKIHIF